MQNTAQCMQTLRNKEDKEEEEEEDLQPPKKNLSSNFRLRAQFLFLSSIQYVMSVQPYTLHGQVHHIENFG